MKDLVVAAEVELSEDVEAKIEREVRRRILADAVQADLVSSGEHSDSPKKKKAPPSTAADLREIKSLKGVKKSPTRSIDTGLKFNVAGAPSSIRKRDFLQWTVKRDSYAQWVASVTTNQKAMEENDDIEMQMSQVAFSAKSQREGKYISTCCIFVSFICDS